MDFPITPGPFAPTWDSIRQNHPGAPECFRDAKLGAFVHWGPQAFKKSGNWYARRIYREWDAAYGNPPNKFGHPSGFGCQAAPASGEILKVKSLGTDARLSETPVKTILPLGGPAVGHKQEADARSITCPSEMPFQHTVGFKIAFEK